jgi:hypothetical protein
LDNTHAPKPGLVHACVAHWVMRAMGCCAGVQLHAGGAAHDRAVPQPTHPAPRHQTWQLHAAVRLAQGAPQGHWCAPMACSVTQQHATRMVHVLCIGECDSPYLRVIQQQHPCTTHLCVWDATQNLLSVQTSAWRCSLIRRRCHGRTWAWRARHGALLYSAQQKAGLWWPRILNLLV